MHTKLAFCLCWKEIGFGIFWILLQSKSKTITERKRKGSVLQAFFFFAFFYKIKNIYFDIFLEKDELQVYA
jgi:hypothetical protein